MTSFNSDDQPHAVAEVATPPTAFTPPIQPRAIWRLCLPLAFQLLLILSIPAQAVYTHVTGKTVILQTAPVDPYDLLRGYYQTLGYEISNPRTLQNLAGWDTLPGTPVECAAEDEWCINRTLNPGTSLYVTLETPEVTEKDGIPQPWKPIAISAEKPEKLSDNQVALRGRYEGWRVIYGLETYYMPEDQRNQVNDHIQETQWKEPEAFVVEVKVDQRGRAVPVSLWVKEKNYRF